MPRERQSRKARTVELDDLDIRLISELQRDAYRTHVELARILGTSKTTVTRRIQRLLKDGVLTIVGVIDAEKIGLGTSALIGLNINLREADAVIEVLEKKPQIDLIAVVTGRYDVVIGVTLSSTTELAAFVRRQIASIPGVLESETLVALEIKKRTHALSIH